MGNGKSIKLLKSFERIVDRVGNISKTVECGHLDFMVVGAGKLSFLRGFMSLELGREKVTALQFFRYPPLGP
jgi:hypothetical protein